MSSVCKQATVPVDGWMDGCSYFRQLNENKTWTIQPRFQCVMGFQPRGKAAAAWSWPLTSNVEVKNAWSYTTSSPYVFMAWYSVKRRTNSIVLNQSNGKHRTSKAYLTHRLSENLTWGTDLISRRFSSYIYYMTSKGMMTVYEKLWGVWT
jgi:hypothetical protein